MLTLTDAWTTDTTGSAPHYSPWLVATDPTGTSWWLTVHVSRMFGFEGLQIQRIIGRQCVLAAIEEDEELYGRPLEIDSLDAYRKVEAEFERVGQALWTHVHADWFRLLIDEYERFRSAVEGQAPVQEYTRFGAVGK